MKCPKCNEEGAYISLLDVECANIACTFYTERQAKEWARSRDTLPPPDGEHDYRPDRPVYIWTNYHSDNGDTD